MEYEIISRAEAIRKGKNKYYTGEPCQRGHLAERFSISATCSGCLKTYRKNAERKFVEKALMESEGYIEITIPVFYDDGDLLRDFAKMIREWRLYPAIAEHNLKAVGDLVRSLNLATKMHLEKLEEDKKCQD